MDGIPVKINEKYKPPRKLSLPSCILNRLNNVQYTSYVYDFSLETTVAEHMARLNKISRDEIEKHEAKTGAEKTSPDKPKAYENDALNEPVMLVPTPISSSQATTSIKGNIFKYSDFENDTSSPFDNEELKTLNDMEELAHVLGATSVSGRTSVEDSTTGRNAKDWPQMNYGSPSQSQYYSNSVSYPISMSTSHPSLSPVTYPTVAGQYNHTQQPTITSYQTPVQYMGVSEQVEDRENKTDEKTDDEDVSEIVKSLQEYLGQRKTDSRAPIVLKETSVPLTSLNDSERATARRIGEMGFPLSRTTAAVRLFGTDETKIIEYLLLAESFVDKGFTESQTLQALEVNQCDENGTDKYLKLLSEIMKLGFKEGEVINALARTGNDGDKAIDILIS